VAGLLYFLYLPEYLLFRRCHGFSWSTFDHWKTVLISSLAGDKKTVVWRRFSQIPRGAIAKMANYNMLCGKG
jgi:hypothetical protein